MSSPDTQLLQPVNDGMSRFVMGVYGVGHVLNDLCAAAWFNYLLYFLNDVLRISSAAAG